MKIAFVVTRADVGGAQVHIRDLSLALMGQGHRVCVLAGGDGAFFEDLDLRGIPNRRLRHMVAPLSPMEDLAGLLELTRALRRIRPDLVAAHTSKAGFLGRLAAAALRLPVVFTPHGWTITDRVTARQGTLFRWLERFASLLTTRIINVCEYELQLALRHRVAPLRKMAVVYNGMADIGPELLADPTRQPPRLVMVARMERQKDHPTLLKALSGLRHLAWHLDLIGEGPGESDLRARVARLELGDRVRFLGFTHHVAPLLAGAQILVLTSRFEAFPYSILEAMRAGLPVAASDVGGVREAVRHQETGLLLPRGDAAAVRAGLERLIADPELRSRMGQAGRARFLAEFTSERMFARTLAVYREAAGEAAWALAQQRGEA